jgi:hypothetical protein
MDADYHIYSLLTTEVVFEEPQVSDLLIFLGERGETRDASEEKS